jgi:hypothetical protein
VCRDGGDCEKCNPLETGRYGNCDSNSGGVSTNNDLASRTGTCDAAGLCKAVYTNSSKLALAVGVVPGMVGNGRCEPVCNVPSCANDGGDCDVCTESIAALTAAGLSFGEYCAPNCRRGMLNNDCCDPGCDNACCGFDNRMCSSVCQAPCEVGYAASLSSFVCLCVARASLRARTPLC